MTSLAYEAKKQRLIDFLRTQGGGHIRLDKTTSNLFRDRQASPARRLDVRNFNNVLHVNVEQG